jgi:hypothetical protein
VLPATVRTAVGRPSDAGGITVAEALELTRLVEHPLRLTEAFEQGRRGSYGGVAGEVRNQVRDLERERKVAEARSRLTSDGVTILKEQSHYSWFGRKEKPLLGCGEDHSAIALAVAQHRAEPCHGAVIDREGRIIYICREPERHANADPRVAEAQRRQRQEREESRLRQEAARRRREAITAVLASVNTSNLPFAARQVLAGWRVDECRLACQLLGIEVRPGPHGSPRYAEALSEHAGASMAAAIKALLALAMAAGEAIVTSSWGGVSERSRRHMELLAAAGYRPNRSDRKHLASPSPADIVHGTRQGDSEEPADG